MSRAVRAGLVLASLTASAACASPVARPADPATAAVPSSAVRVGLTDFAVVARPATAAPGEVELSVTNAGATVHDLVVRGAAGQWQTPVLRPGESTVLRVVARAGERLELLCSVAGHESAGMQGTMPVAGGAGG